MNNLKSNPVGVDYEIDLLQKYIYKKLPFHNIEGYGRAYIVEKDNKKIPTIYCGDKDYESVLNDRKGDVKFFFLENPKTTLSGAFMESTLELIFMVNLLKAYNTISERKDEEFKIEVLNILSRKTHNTIEIKKGIEAISDFGTTLKDMNPYHYVKFSFDIKYQNIEKC